MQNWFVYIAQTRSGYYYTGISNNVINRIKKHNTGKGSRFARMHSGFSLVYTSEPMTKSECLKREIQIKHWKREKKENLINGIWT